MSCKKSPPSDRNRTIRLEEGEQEKYRERLLTHPSQPLNVDDITNKTIYGDTFKVVPLMPHGFVDLLFLDPMYNLDKEFDRERYKKVSTETYMRWIESWLEGMIPLLKPHASVYFCADWESSVAVYQVMSKYFTVQNRITWEREKGRGSRKNWKNTHEDIWYGTLDKDNYKFYPDSVKVKKRVLAPYRVNGNPKDWIECDGQKFRLTYASNLWTDLTVPFWSMRENTGHPFQKPEKMLAKLILASTDPGDFVFDPFSGSGTSLVTADKLDRMWCGIEKSEVHACIGEKRLDMAKEIQHIQGYEDGVFLDRLKP